jgi:hypothetical protein
MKSLLPSAHTLTILFLILVGCQKKDEPQPDTTAACRIQKEMTNGDYLLYSYDEEGNPTKIETHNPYVMTNVLDVFYDKIATTEVNKLHPITMTTNYGVGLLTMLPDVASTSVTMDDVTQVNWRTHFFRYDFNGRLVRVARETQTIPGDDEWELLISYNEQDNIIKMIYQLTTGARSVSSVIIVDGYDNNPSPYAGVKAYEYILNKWDNADLVVIALSKNNPTSYRLFLNDVETMKSSLQYQYNEHGFPTTRAITRKNDTGESTTQQTYEYVCP